MAKVRPFTFASGFSYAKSTMEKSTSGFAFAAAAVASPSRKPTVVIELQPESTICLMLSPYSESEFDSTSAV